MPRPKRGDAEIMREAKARFQRCTEWEATARSHAEQDARFAEGDALNGYQWPVEITNARQGRPCLTHNKVRQHNLMIVNDARQNKAQIKVTPTGDGATYESAQVFAGLVRRIEYQSKAIDAYSTATWHQVQTGVGYVRVITEYTDAQGFDQEIYIRRIADPFSVYLDPDAKDYDKGDMRFGFVFEDIPKDQWEAEHGEFDEITPQALDAPSHAIKKDHVRVAEYWRRNIDTDTIHMLRDGRVLKQSDLDDAQMEMFKPLIERSRDTEESSVEWFKIAGSKIIDRGDWAGKHIPIVPFIGEETVIDGVFDRKGHTRSQIDAQRIYNYWASAAVEQVALQSKTPYVADLRAVDGLETYWHTANTKNHAYLPYNGKGDDGQDIPAPQRVEPPAMSQAYIQGMTLARQDLLEVTGQYQAELGMPSNERSGVAIQQRQRQGDTATYHYIDNQAKGIRQVGRILLDLIPKIYDVTRVMKVMGEDGSEQDVLVTQGLRGCHQQVQLPSGQPITPEQQEQMRAGAKLQGILCIFNPSVGKYDVEADVGPSFGTQRQEAANAFSQIMQANPAAFQIVGDFWAQNSDFPGADDLAERLRRGLPPQYQPGPSPREQQMQQLLQQTNQNAQQTLQKADAHIAMLNAQLVHAQEQLKGKAGDLAIKALDQENKAYAAETDRLKAVGQIDPLSLQIVVRQLLRDMLQTDIIPHLQRHADIEGDLQARLQPPMQPVNGDMANPGGQQPQPWQQQAQPPTQ